MLANTLALAGGTIRSASSQADAALAHVGHPHNAAHKVDWRLSPDSGTPPDTTPPRLVGGEVDGATMTLTFSEALDEGSTGGRFLVDLASETPTVGFHATGPVTVDGAVVTVGLGAGNPRAKAGLLDGNRVLYARRANGAGALGDLAGNPVLAPHVLPYSTGEAWRSSEEWRYVRIALDNVTVAVPAVTGVEVTSEAGDDDTYALGETIEVTVTFSEAVAVTGAPRLKLGLGAGDERWAVYESGSGTAALVFAHEVAEPSLSTRGIAVLANTLALNGGTIKSRSSQTDADLAHTGLAPDAAHKVDGAVRTPRRRGCRGRWWTGRS